MEIGQRRLGAAAGLSGSASPSEWPLCCTRLGPPTAMGLGGLSMHRWRRGPRSPCPWGTPASGRPLCMCWGISCRALGCWLPPSSSTSRYCPSGLPQPSSCNPAPHPFLPTASLPDSSSPGLWAQNHGPFSLGRVLGGLIGPVCPGHPRSSSEWSLVPGLRGVSFSSLSTKQLTPSAPSSSLSVLLGPRLPPFEMFFAYSWKVNQMHATAPHSSGPSDLTPTQGASLFSEESVRKKTGAMGFIAKRRNQAR